MNKIKFRVIILILSLIGIISVMTITISGEVKKVDSISDDYKNKLIRFHVIANSDTDEDQELKLKVRDAVIAYLQPKLIESTSIAQSEEIIKNEYDELGKISKNIICKNGYNYDVKVGIKNSTFPTKQYSSVILPAGEYKALKIVIGKGQGKNWWCVMFPPLCFVDEANGVIDKATDKKLKEVLTEDEYKLITQKTQKDMNKMKVKFKVVEILDKYFKK